MPGSSVEIESPFLDVEAAAKYLFVPRSTLYQFTHLKLIPFHKRGKKIYFKVKDLDNWAVGDDSRVASKAELKKEVESELS